MQLGRNAEAMEQLEIVLSTDGAPQQLTDLASQLSEEIAPQTGRINLEVSGVDGPVTVAVDGEELPDERTQRPIRVDPGTHLIAVSIRGEVVGRRLVEVASGSMVDVRFEVQPPQGTPEEPLGSEPGHSEDDPVPDEPTEPLDDDSAAPTEPADGGVRVLDVGQSENGDEGETPLVRDWRLWVGVGSAAAAIAIVIGIVVGVGGGVEDPIEGNMEPGVWVW